MFFVKNQQKFFLKMENFKLELEKKERYYLEIEKENKRLKPYYEKFNQLKGMMEETLEKVFYILIFRKFLGFLLDREKRDRKPEIKGTFG